MIPYSVLHKLFVGLIRVRHEAHVCNARMELRERRNKSNEIVLLPKWDKGEIGTQ